MKKMMLLFALCATVCGFAAETKPLTVAEAIIAYELTPAKDTAKAVMDAAGIVQRAGGDLTAADAFFDAAEAGTPAAQTRARYRFERHYIAREYAKARPYAIEANHSYGLRACDRALLNDGLIQPAVVVADMQNYLGRRIGGLPAKEALAMFDLWYEAVLVGDFPDAEVKTALTKYLRLFTARAMTHQDYETLRDKAEALLKRY